ncbi:MAG: SBBP repeat-containing protein [Flavobacteriales bacterium]|uniref:T9SS type A sorting domain-containing protein n=1 Tax=Candidatus Ulvibacter alkanivorans TaxID=2267620 RepID=UPI000DF185C4|nr:T9SS type A sorting domain-containing protein [Candidatus Ulvibacter alkanivorans]MCH2489238.1 SBBP repeat-containing protein [Flavobacteriales bacterium]
MINKKFSVLLFCLCLSISTIGQSFEWGGPFGGAGEDVIKKMHVDANGNSYTTGYFTDTADFDITSSEFNLISNGFYDVFVQKTNADGTLEWAVNVGGSMFDYGTGITTDDQGNVYITGYFDDTVDFNPGADEWLLTSQGGGDVFILKLNSDGAFMWAKSVGGADYEESTDIGVDELGNVYVLGYLYETADFDPNLGEVLITSQGASDTFLLKLDSAGDFVNVYSYGGTNLDLALDMEVKNSNEIYISGFFEGTSDLDPRPSEEYFVTATEGFAGYSIKVDGLGGITNVVLTEGGEVIVYAVTTDTENNVYLTGHFNGTVNFDPTSGSGEYTFTSTAAYNSFILKVLADGSIAWARHLTSTDPLFAYDIAVGPNENVHTVGYFGGTADFDPDVNDVFELTKESVNASDAFISILNSNGMFINAYQFGGVDFIDTHQLGVDDQNNIYLAAQFGNTVDIDPNPFESTEVTAIDFRDNYLIKIVDEELAIPDHTRTSISIYPNPTQEVINIKASNNLIGESVVIYNTLGQEISKHKLNQNLTIPVTDLQSGIYLLKVGSHEPLKFIKL